MKTLFLNTYSFKEHLLSFFLLENAKMSEQQ